MLNRFFAGALVCALASATSAVAEDVTVTFTDMHICCGACVKAIDAIAAKVDGAKVEVNQDESSVTITAADAKTVRKAINRLAAGGFHGATTDKKMSMRAQKDAPSGKATKLTVSGIHNCCGACASAIKEAVGGVAGVTGNTIKAKETSFDVEGDFEIAALVKALNDAGFHVSVAK